MYGISFRSFVILRVVHTMIKRVKICRLFHLPVIPLILSLSSESFPRRFYSPRLCVETFTPNQSNNDV